MLTGFKPFDPLGPFFPDWNQEVQLSSYFFKIDGLCLLNNYHYASIISSSESSYQVPF